MKLGYLISAYLIRSVMPYFAMAWLILTVILFLQQAGRYSEIFFTPNLPSSLAWQIATALIPNVIAFTCPMAVLIGVIVGLSRMHADNELTAVRSFGTGNTPILVPMISLGVILSIVSIVINIYGVPFAAKTVRAAAMQSAIYKLESPIEPGVFNTEVSGFTIYVKEGDVDNGTWQDVVVFNTQGQDGASRLITAESGRIDSQGQKSELVLQGATITTFPGAGESQGIIREKLGELRFSIKTRRDEMIDRLSLVQPVMEELGVGGLAQIAREGNEKESREATILLVRRLVLAIAPLLFCILGTAIVLRYDRKGRGVGISLAIVVLISYFFLMFAGEQLARSGVISPIVGGLLPVLAAGLATTYFLLVTRFPGIFKLRNRGRMPSSTVETTRKSHRGSDVFLDITTGIRDFDLVVSILKYFFLTIVFIGAIFIVFTAFELWRFAGSFDDGPLLLLKYIFYLVPFIYLQIAATSVLVAVLTALTIKSRQNEIVTWLMAGESIYRLILPILLLMLFLGIGNFAIQEFVATESNIRQEALRQTIRNRGVVKDLTGKQWAANENTIYSFEYEKDASDNGQAGGPFCPDPCTLKSVSIYNFTSDKVELQSIYRIPTATLSDSQLTASPGSEALLVSHQEVVRKDISGQSIKVGFNLALNAARKPSELTVGQIRELLARSDSEVETRLLAVTLERKFSTIVMPLLIALIAIPFAIAIERRNRVTHIAYAVGLWLVFIVFSSIFVQFGLNGMLPAKIAVWSPIVLFAILGGYLISRIRT